jgi:hypothetical protein
VNQEDCGHASPLVYHIDDGRNQQTGDVISRVSYCADCAALIEEYRAGIAFDRVMFACTIDYSLTAEPFAEPVERIARREWQSGSAWRDVATTLPFETQAQAEVAGNLLLGELVAAIDTGGKTKWTHVFECDDCDVNKVAVFDPYGTCALVLWASCNGGEAAAGPIYYAE